MRDCKESGAHDYEVVDGRNRDECGAQDDVRDCKASGAHDEERRHRSPRFKRRSSKSTTTFAL